MLSKEGETSGVRNLPTEFWAKQNGSLYEVLEAREGKASRCYITPHGGDSCSVIYATVDSPWPVIVFGIKELTMLL